MPMRAEMFRLIAFDRQGVRGVECEGLRNFK
jgi:hypothetical protein